MEPKYKIGQTVWRLSGGVVAAPITVVGVHKDSKGYWYGFSEGAKYTSMYFDYPEDKLFLTKAELLASL